MTETQKIIERHRQECNQFAELCNEAIKQQSVEKLEFVQLFAETLAITQDCERRAWAWKVRRIWLSGVGQSWSGVQKMAKLSKTEWLDVRSKWEADTKLSFGYLAAEYGVSKQVICSRSKKENWELRGNLADINRDVIRRANGFTGSIKTDEKAVETPCLKGDIGFDDAVDRRADILVKHRDQIITLDEMQDEAKSLFYLAMAAKITADTTDEQKVKTAKNLWWQAKIAIDTCKDHIAAAKLKQTMERKAWGMDECELSAADLESMTDAELDYLGTTGRIPMRFRKIA